MALDSLALLLGGLSHATVLFLMACGLTLVFGVTRIVNFAHGSFFMLGTLFSAHTQAPSAGGRAKHEASRSRTLPKLSSAHESRASETP